MHDRSTVSLKNIRRTHLNRWFKVKVCHDFLECAPTRLLPFCLSSNFVMQNVTFTACGNTLDTTAASSGKRPTLIDGINETKTGSARIITLQEQGWRYLSP